MPTKFNFDNVLSNFVARIPMVAWECRGQLIDGEWVWDTLENERAIQGIIHDKKQTKQFIDNAGLYEEGDTNIITKAVLYFTDRGDGDNRNVQSWVKFRGRTYKVLGEATMQGKSYYNSYNCIREVL
jgi:hypothetical protein